MKARDYEIIEKRFNINVNVFRYENRVFLLYVSKKSNEQVSNVLLINNEEHKKHFCVSCLQNFTTKEILNNHREQYLLINDNQAVKYETGTIKFKNFNNQIHIPFKTYADSEGTQELTRL